jgi:hypothetical protein
MEYDFKNKIPWNSDYYITVTPAMPRGMDLIINYTTLNEFDQEEETWGME